MKMKRVIVLVFLIGLLIFIGACYIEPNGEGSEYLTLNIDLHSQAAVGYNGDGIYIKAYVYEEDDVLEMQDQEVLLFVDNGYSYNPDNLFVPLNTQAFYVAQDVVDSTAITGIIAIIDLPPTRRYRIFLEWIDFSATFQSDPQYAGLTNVLNISSGTAIITSVDLYDTYLTSV